jgi:hypothetical protein
MRRVEGLRDADWRTLSAGLAREWEARNLPNDDPGIYTHVVRQDRNGCLCCDTLVFTTDRPDSHLQAVVFNRAAGSKAEAVALANRVVRSALKPDELFRPIEITDAGDVSRSFGHPGPQVTVLLDVRVFRRDNAWIANIYWSRISVDT